MTTLRIIEEDRGTYTRSPHPHNGYYAGDFSASFARPASPAVARTVSRNADWPAAPARIRTTAS